MTIQEILTNTPANAFQLQEKRPGTFQLIAPIFHDDGDMVSIYLEKASDDAIRICDHGMSLMRLSYLFDIDSDKKQKVLNDIISNRGASLESGSIELIVPNDNLFCGIMSYSQLVSEVCNMEILSREMVSSLFYDHLSESVELIREKSDLTYIKDYQVPGHPDMNVDFAFLGTGKVRPSYLFGVKDTNKAQQTTINCLNLTLDKIPHRSVSVFENIDGVTTFSRNALINASGKVYSDLASFQKNGAVYIKTELAG